MSICNFSYHISSHSASCLAADLWIYQLLQSDGHHHFHKAGSNEGECHQTVVNTYETLMVYWWKLCRGAGRSPEQHSEGNSRINETNYCMRVDPVPAPLAWYVTAAEKSQMCVSTLVHCSDGILNHGGPGDSKHSQKWSIPTPVALCLWVHR